MIARRTAIRIAAVIGAATVAAVVAGRILAPAPRKLATPPLAAEPEAVGVARARWVVDLGPGLTAPDRAVHAPIVVGNRLLVAASRIGFAALDVATGAVAWRRPASPDLAAPLVLAPHDVIEVAACDEAIGVAAGRTVVACFARIDPLDIAARAAGAIHAADADAAPCLASTAAWQLQGDATAIVLRRDACALAVALPAGAATAIAASPPRPPPEPGADCEATADGTPWCQRVADGRSTVEVAGVRVDGIAVLAAASDSARAVVVVRRDASLAHDDVVGVEDGAVVWTWRLPEPAQPRATPVAVTMIPGGAYVVFDSTRVAALAAP